MFGLNELSFCIQSCNTNMQLHKHCGFDYWQRHVTAKMSDFLWRKIKTVVFQIPTGWGRAFNWRLSSDGTETCRDSWSQRRDDKLDVCIAMVNRNNNIVFFFLLSLCFYIFLCIYWYCFSSLITWERSYRSYPTNWTGSLKGTYVKGSAGEGRWGGYNKRATQNNAARIHSSRP